VLRRFAEVKLGRLLPEFIQEITAGNIRIKPRNTDFSKVNPDCTIPPHIWSLMIAGEVVEWRYIAAFLNYLQQRRSHAITKAKAEAAAENVDPRGEWPVDPYSPDPWTVGWEGIIAWLGRAHCIHPDSFCRGDGDLSEMARMILESIGRAGTHRGHLLADQAAREAGEPLAGIAYGPLVDWLAALHDKNPRSVMFAVDHVPHNGERSALRLGATVILPLTEPAYLEFRKGRLAYPDLAPAAICDSCTPTRHLLIHSYSEVKPSECRLRKKISSAQLRTSLYQMAQHCARQLQPDVAPSLLCMPPLPEYAERARVYGFTKLTTKEPATDASIWELTPDVSGAYVAMMSMLCAWQWLHRPDVSR